MTERGVIRNARFAQQLRDFSGLRFERGITPTDIDIFMEFGNKLYIICELKFGEVKVQGGQRMALERLADTVGETKECVLIFAKHNTPPESPIDAGNCEVVEYRWKRKWHPQREPITVRALIDKVKTCFPI